MRIEYLAAIAIVAVAAGAHSVGSLPPEKPVHACRHPIGYPVS